MQLKSLQQVEKSEDKEPVTSEQGKVGYSHQVLFTNRQDEIDKDQSIWLRPTL